MCLPAKPLKSSISSCLRFPVNTGHRIATLQIVWACMGTNRHTIIPNDSDTISACLDGDPKLSNCEIDQLSNNRASKSVKIEAEQHRNRCNTKPQHSVDNVFDSGGIAHRTMLLFVSISSDGASMSANFVTISVDFESICADCLFRIRRISRRPLRCP